MGASGLTDQQRRWIEESLPLVLRLAAVLERQVSHLSKDELVSAGHEGLTLAALRYDPGAGVPFAAYALHRIRGAMLDAARRAVPSIRQRTRALRVLQATQSLLEDAQRRGLAHEADSLKSRVESAQELVMQATTAVLVSRLAPEDPDSVQDARGAENELLDAETRAKIRAALEACRAEDRALIESLYFEGLSMKELAAKRGKSASTISRQHARVLTRLAKHLRGDDLG